MQFWTLVTFQLRSTLHPREFETNIALRLLSPRKEDHVEDEDESAGAEDRDDDGQDDVQLPVLLLLQAET